MNERPSDPRAEATEHFAAVLRGVRTAAGNPSFREMSGRSQAISHTTLHEAAQGHRLPSWATTVEFVKACGADPADYRQRWDDACRDIRVVTRSGADQAGDLAEVGSAAPDSKYSRRHALVGVAAGVAVVAGVLGIIAATASGDSSKQPAAARTDANVQMRSADCPIAQRNPPVAPPRHQGDASVFIADIKLPDCTHVARGHQVVKVWRLKNIGTRTWSGYTLHRVDLPERRDQCQTISDVPVPTTHPGHTVDVRVDVTTPQRPGFCFVRFKMQDSAGELVFPGSRPVNFQLIVD